MILLWGEDGRAAVDVRGDSASVDGTPQSLAVRAVGPSTWELRDGTRRETFRCVRAGKHIHLHWRGRVYVLEEEAEGARPGQRAHGGGLEAPMPGKVIAVKAAVGQAVRKGDEILVVEAMKMENAVRAPRDGVVKSLRAKVGDMVAPGTVLAELE